MMTMVRGLLLGLLTILPIGPAASAQEAFDRIIGDAMPKPAPKPVRMRGRWERDMIVEGRDLQLLRGISIEPPARPTPGDEEDPPRRPEGMGIDLDTAIVGRENFDRRLFGEGIDESQCVAHLERAFRTAVDRAAEEHRLDDRERAKLRLAGRGDIKHFLDRIDAMRADFESARKSLPTAIPSLR